jgi:hypothetical protein
VIILPQKQKKVKRKMTKQKINIFLERAFEGDFWY